MLFHQMIKRLLIDVFEFFALLFCLLFIYTQMIPFVKAAFSLNYVNGQAISYIIFSLLLLIFPLVLLWHPIHFDKATILRRFFYCFGIIILTGTVFDLILYNAFIGYTYAEGDMIFVNILWNIPNIYGAVFSCIIAVLYLFLGKWIKRRRRISYILYLVIFILSAAVPFVYTYYATGFLPRETWLQKAVFIISEQLLVLTAFTICASSRTLWKQHIWN